MTLSALLLFLFAPVTDQPFVELPPIFGDGMILQRDSEIAVWGAAQPGSVVSLGASWLEVDVRATTNDKGRWRASIPTASAGGPHALVVASSDGAEFLATDVWLGEVWLASGQSNMEWTLGPGVGPGTDAWREEVAGANLPLVRAFRVHKQTAWAPREVAANDGWVSITPDTAAARSAVAYYFARQLWDELRVPIGIVETSWSDTRIEAWTSAEAQADEPGLAQELASMATNAASPGREDQAARERRLDWWRQLEQRDPGSRGRWMASGLKTIDWNSTELPATFSEHSGSGYDGTLWYRRAFTLSSEEARGEFTLSLGPIDDCDTTWVNGVRVGGLEDSGSLATPRRYTLPRGLVRAGKNVVTVRALDTGGVGGFTGEAEDLVLEAASQRIELSGRWSWKRGVSLYDLPAIPRGSWLDERRPSALFNAMIAPWVGYGIAGFVWYQGESNRLEPVEYRRRFPRLIQDWRTRWGRGDLPFYFVQIAPHGYAGDRGEASELREAQAAALELAETGMAVTTDIGDPANIHPSNKRAVGDRLARLALRRTYGRSSLIDEGPRLTGWQIDGPELRLTFSGELRFEGAAPGPFTIAGEDQRFFRADARMDRGDVVLSSTLVTSPAAARFAWGAADRGNLRNTADLPAAPFRTDAWLSVTRGGPTFDPR